MAGVLEGVANIMLALLALGLAVAAGAFALLVPWWLSAAGAVAISAAWPAHRRWARERDAR
jgi:hypothetical protein